MKSFNDETLNYLSDIQTDFDTSMSNIKLSTSISMTKVMTNFKSHSFALNNTVTLRFRLYLIGL